MKGKHLTQSLGLMLSLVLFACKSPSGSPSSPANRTEPRSLKLSLDHQSIQLRPLGEGSTLDFDIVEGNGDYRFTFSISGIIDARLKDKTHVVLTALKPGKTVLRLTDARQQTQEVDVTVLSYTPLSLDTKTLLIDLDKDPVSSTVHITGNGKYKIGVPDDVKPSLQVKLSDDSSELLIKVDNVKIKTTITVTDIYTKEEMTLELSVKPKSLKSLEGVAKPIDFSIWSKETRESMCSIIEDTVRESDEWYRKVSECPIYPEGKYHYDNQRSTFNEGVKIYDVKKKYFNRNKETASAAELWDCYVDLYQYGKGYAYIEYMARQAELFRKKYPTNKTIEDFIEKTFDGNYTSQEGDVFIVVLNRDYIKEYNKIVDLFNRLERE